MINDTDFSLPGIYIDAEHMRHLSMAASGNDVISRWKCGSFGGIV